MTDSQMTGGLTHALGAVTDAADARTWRRAGRPSTRPRAAAARTPPEHPAPPDDPPRTHGAAARRVARDRRVPGMDRTAVRLRWLKIQQPPPEEPPWLFNRKTVRAFDAPTSALEDISGDYTIDPSHSRLGFSARHAMVTTVRGQFADFAGTAHIDTANPAASTVSLTIRTACIDTGSADRDGHLPPPTSSTPTTTPRSPSSPPP